MSARDIKKLMAGDLLLIKKGYTWSGENARYIGGESRLPYLRVILPGQLEPCLRHHCMFSVRTPSFEGVSQ